MENLMPKYFSKIAVSIIVTLSLCIPAHASWLIYHKPEFKGKVIDAETKEPIKGAVVVVIYNKHTLISGPGGGYTSVIKVKEALTDKNGEYYFPRYTTVIQPNSIEDSAEFIIYKPGYESSVEFAIWALPNGLGFSSDKFPATLKKRVDDKWKQEFEDYLKTVPEKARARTQRGNTIQYIRFFVPIFPMKNAKEKLHRLDIPFFQIPDDVDLETIKWDYELDVNDLDEKSRYKVIGLPKAKTWEERNKANMISLYGDVPKTDWPLLNEMIEREEKWLHESKNKEWVNYHSNTALISIAKEGRINVAKSLIANGANVNYSTHVLRTALMEAAREGHSNMLMILLENGADVNLKSSQTGRTALMDASREGYLTEVQLLIKAGADPNIKDMEGNTALIDAVGSSVQTAKKESSQVEIIKALIDGGADINYNRQGETALKGASRLNRSKVINTLISGGIKISLEDASSGLIFAVSSGNIEAAKILIKNGADINYRSAGFGMMTPLIYAAKQGHLNIVQMLIDLGADVNAHDAQSKTARMLAEEAGHSDIAAVLKNVEIK